MAENKSKNIIELITEVKRKAGALGKDQTSGVPFPFRGIDGTVNHLAKHVEEAGIVVVPHVDSHVVTERSPDGKRVVKTSQVETSFTFYAPDGSSITAKTAGLADDFADRSSAQAQSVAFRVALLQTFFLPTQSPEPEQTGQVVQDGLAAGPAKTATERKLDNARKAPEQAVKAQESAQKAGTPRDEVRTEWIERGKITKETANEKYEAHKAKGLKGDAIWAAVLEELNQGSK